MLIYFTPGQDPMLTDSEQQWLLLAGSKENLAVYVDFFHFDQDEAGAHHHTESADRTGNVAPGTMSLIIEVDFDD